MLILSLVSLQQSVYAERPPMGASRRGVASKVVTMALESSTKRRYVAGVSLHSRTKITKEGHHAHVIIGNFDSEEESQGVTSS